MKEEIYLATIETLTQKIVDLKEENANIKKEHEVQMQCMRDSHAKACKMYENGKF